MTKNTTEGRLPSLNGLRAISIIIVVIHHLCIHYDFFAKWDSIPYPDCYFEFLRNGQFGVNVFFVISGFLITSLLLKEENANQTISLKNFYIRRTFRIFPAYYFLLSFYLVLQFTHYFYLSRSSWLTSFTYTKYLNWKLDWYTAHAWSLSVEEQFYLLWPLVFLLGNKLRKGFAFLLVLVVPIIRIIVHVKSITWFDELSIFLRIDSISMGCLFALYKDSLLKKISEKSWKVIFYSSILMIIFFSQIYSFSTKLNLEKMWIPLGKSHGTIMNICISFAIFYSVYFAKGIWFNVLNSKLFNFIGTLSYSIYLWQNFFLIPKNHWYKQLPYNMFMILICALISYYFIELPFLKLKDKFQPNSKTT